ncbi:zinc knuckle CX2CX4HX4C containing protein [Tanacetum coccineum]|uniref:Zinc knuckle CX2CX4HX4C containing protein n=1 Tax=Tanacetum coccineum TaxID=301880 RepID=A0ABQ5AFZ9_9ASTR
MEPGGSISSNLVDKIRNIDGKIIKEGKLRSAMRGVVKVGSYVESLDGSLHAKDSGLPPNKTMPPINEDASEIFGEPAAYVNVVEDNMVNQDTTTKSTAFTFSFANILNRNSNPNKKIVKLQELRNPERVDGAAVAIPMEAVEEVSSRFSNTLYGYFIGKRLAFPLVENYVKNTWAKFGLKRTQLHEDFFMFQFNTKEGMESVMESGPWLVRGVPLILNIWNQNSELKKDAIKSAPLWVKLHHVPIVAYSEIGLSLITTQLGKPIMLDSYTSNMCLSSWGRNTYARALVEFSAEEELKDSIVIAILLINGKGHTLAKIDVEWLPTVSSSTSISRVVPEDHIPVYIPELEHPEDLVPAEDEAPIPPLSPSFLAPRIRPLSPRALEVEMRDIASSFYHSLHLSGTPSLLPILILHHLLAAELIFPRLTHRLRRDYYLLLPDLGDRAAVRAEIEVLRRERLAYEQESMETRQALARSEAHCRALEARVTILETEVDRHE